MKTKAIDIIEAAKTYDFLSKDRKTKPIPVGNRKRLALVLKDVDADMIIATAGNAKKCLILIDYSVDDLWNLIQKADVPIIDLEAKN